MTKKLCLMMLVCACNQQTIQTPIRSFDRPSDIALLCRSYDPYNGVFNPRDLEDCSPASRLALSTPNPDPRYPGTTIFPELRALVTQTTRGELAAVDVERGYIVDLKSGVPGFNFLPVGKLPEHVRASPDGCRAVTSNAGSCDLAVVDVAVLYRSFYAELGQLTKLGDGGIGTMVPIDPRNPDGGYKPVPANDADHVVQRVRPSVGGVPLKARPAWIEIAPESTKGTRAQDLGGAPGQCFGGSYRAWVALPGCQLVVEVSLDDLGLGNAEVVRAVRVLRDRSEIVTDLSTLSCAAECDGEASPQDLSFAAAADLGPGLLPDVQAFPSALAIDFEADTGRLIIGDSTSPRLSILPLDAGGALGAPRSLTLADNAGGVELVRVSPRTPAGKFLYGVARDASVRVVDLDREVECETHPNPRVTPAPSGGGTLLGVSDGDPRAYLSEVGCFPLGDPSTPPRSPGYTTPGIVLANNALPRDIAFVHVDIPPPIDPTLQQAPYTAAPVVLMGDFAWVLGSDGRATVVNIFDACPGPNLALGGPPYTPACDVGNIPASRESVRYYPGRPRPLWFERLAHRIRNGDDRFKAPTNCSDTSGSARLADENNPVTISVGASNNPNVTTTIDMGVGGNLPSLVKIEYADQGGGCGTSHSVGFFDPDVVRNETWTVAWEGPLPSTSRITGRLVPGGLLVDAGAAFCAHAALAGDKVYLAGCTLDTDCDFAQFCYRDPAAPSNVITGMCLDREPGLAASQKAACSPLLRGVRRYRVASVRQAPAPGLTEDTLKLAEIYEPENGAADCVPGGSCAAINEIVGGLTTALPTQCLRDWDGQFRCLRACDGGASGGTQCGDGYQCAESHDAAGALAGPRCLRIPLDDAFVTPRERGGAGCLREAQPYELHAGDSFLVVGSFSGFLANYKPGPDGECRLADNAATSAYVRLRQPRIPLRNIPDCPTSPAPTVCSDNAQCSSNMCVGNACACASDVDCPANTTCLANHQCALSALNAMIAPSDPTRNVCRLNGDIHFENPILAFGLHIPDNDIPERLVLSFAVVGGGFPVSAQMGNDVGAQMPRAAVVHPDRQNVFVVDEGKQSTGSGTRGQLFRLSTLAVGTDRAFIVR